MNLTSKYEAWLRVAAINIAEILAIRRHYLATREVCQTKRENLGDTFCLYSTQLKLISASTSLAATAIAIGLTAVSIPLCFFHLSAPCTDSSFRCSPLLQSPKPPKTTLPTSSTTGLLGPSQLGSIALLFRLCVGFPRSYGINGICFGLPTTLNLFFIPLR